jgi:hypothetical protein
MIKHSSVKGYNYGILLRKKHIKELLMKKWAVEADPYSEDLVAYYNATIAKEKAEIKLYEQLRKEIAPF